MINKKWFLYSTEFFSGMSVMAVELGASRMLAPYFSSSQIIWTIIIGTIMIAMALGNVIGGRLADKKQNPHRLYFCLMLAALWIGLIPFAGKYVIIAVAYVLSLFITTNFLIWAAFISCFLLFVFPLLILGMVTPTLAKHATNSLENNGKIVGELGAICTIGSILGTFLPTFIIIPTAGTAATFLIFSSIVFLIAAVYFITVRRKIALCCIEAIIIVIMITFVHRQNFAIFTDDIVYEGESIYNYLQVTENDDRISFSTNVLFGVQSIKMKNGSGGFYYDYAMAAPYMANFSELENPRVLILGLGTGTFAMEILARFPNAIIEAVEIDSKIVDLAYDYFSLSEQVKVTVADGRAYMRNAGEYDLIMVDAYQDITIPFQMSTVEFFQIIEDHLTKDGVMLVNLNMFSEKEGSINDYLMDTICSIFPHVYQYNISNSTNCELFASNNPDIAKNLAQTLETETRPSYRSYLRSVSNSLVKVKGGNRLLTDDKAPVELLGMSVLDDLIKVEIEYYRELLKGKGIKDLLDMFR